MTSEEQNLLRKAVADPKGQIAIKRTRRGAWHPDRDRLDGLARGGHLLPLGERMGPHLGGDVRPLADHGGWTSHCRMGWFGPS